MRQNKGFFKFVFDSAQSTTSELGLSGPVSANGPANVTWSCSPRISPKQELNKTVSADPS